MEIYQNKPRIKLSPTVRYGRKFIEVSFDHDGLRLPLSKEEGAQLVGGKAYLPEESFVLAEFFDRYVKMAFIDYSAIKGYTDRKEKEDSRPPLPAGYLEKLRQVRYSDHTVRVYTSYFRDFQEHFRGRNVKSITSEDINGYLLYLIHERNISSCQQNQRINAIKFYYAGSRRSIIYLSFWTPTISVPNAIPTKVLFVMRAKRLSTRRFWD